MCAIGNADHNQNILKIEYFLNNLSTLSWKKFVIKEVEVSSFGTF